MIQEKERKEARKEGKEIGEQGGRGTEYNSYVFKLGRGIGGHENMGLLQGCCIEGLVGRKAGKHLDMKIYGKYMGD